MPVRFGQSRRQRITAGLGTLALAAGLLVAQPPSRTDSVPPIDSSRLLSNLAALSADSMEGRRAGTPGGERARNFLLREFARIGLQPAVRGFAVAFSARSASVERRPGDRPPCPRMPAGRTPPVRDGSCDPFPRPNPLVRGVNLLGLVRGTVNPERYVVVSAHYDHLGIKDDEIYNGADDNASGSTAILAIAEWAVTHPPRNSILFAWFDAEESGLLGSTAFIRDPSAPLARIAADVNVDMVGRNWNGEVYAAGARLYPVMQPLVDSVRAIGLTTLRQGHDGDPPKDDWTQRSDEGPFHDRHIPFIHFGNDEHPDYHRPTDDFARIHPSFFYQNVRTIAEFVRQLDRGLDPVAASRGMRP